MKHKKKLKVHTCFNDLRLISSLVLTIVDFRLALKLRKSLSLSVGLDASLYSVKFVLERLTRLSRRRWKNEDEMSKKNLHAQEEDSAIVYCERHLNGPWILFFHIKGSINSRYTLNPVSLYHFIFQKAIYFVWIRKWPLEGIKVLLTLHQHA